MLFASWGGIPIAAPVPAWMPTLSTIATAFLLLPVAAVALNVYRTTGRVVLVVSGNLPLSFVLVGAAAFVMVAGMTVEADRPLQIAAQVVTGIGFIGGGVIFREGVSIKGLNTWVAGGIVQGLELQDPKIPFVNIMKGSLLFLRVSTIGDLLLLLGHLVFLGNVIGLVVRYYRARAKAAYAAVTADLFKTAEAKT